MHALLKIEAVLPNKLMGGNNEILDERGVSKGYYTKSRRLCKHNYKLTAVLNERHLFQFANMLSGLILDHYRNQSFQNMES